LRLAAAAGGCEVGASPNHCQAPTAAAAGAALLQHLLALLRQDGLLLLHVVLLQCGGS
jgi:hypothetical protein